MSRQARNRVRPCGGRCQMDQGEGSWILHTHKRLQKQEIDTVHKGQLTPIVGR